MEWIKTAEQRPDDRQVVIAHRRVEWMRGDTSGTYWYICLLVYNADGDDWDQEDGDDHECELKFVDHWMPFTTTPR